jgi:hypothetical protein
VRGFWAAEEGWVEALLGQWIKRILSWFYFSMSCLEELELPLESLKEAAQQLRIEVA